MLEPTEHKDFNANFEQAFKNIPPLALPKALSFFRLRKRPAEPQEPNPYGDSDLEQIVVSSSGKNKERGKGKGEKPDQLRGDEEGARPLLAESDKPKNTYRTQARVLMAHNIVIILIILFLILAFEEESLTVDPNYSISKVVFEVVSAYGNVGLSLGYLDYPYSFSGTWSIPSKLLLIVIMLMGRHRYLPESIDTAIQLNITDEVLPLTSKNRANNQPSGSGQVASKPSLLAIKSNQSASNISKQGRGTSNAKIKLVIAPEENAFVPFQPQESKSRENENQSEPEKRHPAIEEEEEEEEEEEAAGKDSTTATSDRTPSASTVSNQKDNNKGKGKGKAEEDDDEDKEPAYLPLTNEEEDLEAQNKDAVNLQI